MLSLSNCYCVICCCRSAVTFAGPSILTNAVWASGVIGAVSSLIVVSTEAFAVFTLTSSNPPTVPSFGRIYWYCEFLTSFS